MADISKAQLARIKREVRKVVNGVVRNISLNITYNLKSNPPIGNPVDTGWSRSQWIVTKGIPFSGTVGDKSSVNNSVSDQSIVSVFTYQVGDGPLYIVNNAPYIGALNDGYSPQSPPEWVGKAIEKAISETRFKGITLKR